MNNETIKRKWDSQNELFTICSSIVVSCGEQKKNICSNRLYQYETDCTWEDVYEDLIQDENFSRHKTDVVSVTVSNSLQCTSSSCSLSMTPDFYNKISVVRDFDKTLKYVSFKVVRDKDIGLTESETAETPPASSINDVLMKASMEKKSAGLKDSESTRFTGNFFF